MTTNTQNGVTTWTRPDVPFPESVTVQVRCPDCGGSLSAGFCYDCHEEEVISPAPIEEAAIEAYESEQIEQMAAEPRTRECSQCETQVTGPTGADHLLCACGHDVAQEEIDHWLAIEEQRRER